MSSGPQSIIDAASTGEELLKLIANNAKGCILAGTDDGGQTLRVPLMKGGAEEQDLQWTIKSMLEANGMPPKSVGMNGTITQTVLTFTFPKHCPFKERLESFIEDLNDRIVSNKVSGKTL